MAPSEIVTKESLQRAFEDCYKNLNWRHMSVRAIARKMFYQGIANEQDRHRSSTDQSQAVMPKLMAGLLEHLVGERNRNQHRAEQLRNADANQKWRDYAEQFERWRLGLQQIVREQGAEE